MILRPATGGIPLRSAKAMTMLGAAIFPISMAEAQESGRGTQVEDIVVTAQKREDNLQRVPVAVSVITEKQLDIKRIDNIGDFTLNVPSMRLTPFLGDKATLGLFIRGVGINDPAQPTRDPAVGVYLNGIYIARSSGLTSDIAEIERMEVLRGPQGALYGRNTTGGVLSIVSARPTGEFGVKQTLSAGSLDYFRTLTTVNLPAIGGLKTRVSYLNSRQDGWVRNTGNGPDFNAEKKQGVMAAASWSDPGDNVQVDYMFDWSSIKGTPNYFQNDVLYPDRLRRTVRNVDKDTFGISDYDIKGHSLIVEWAISDSLSVKSLTGYRTMDTDVPQDFDTTLSPGIVFAARSALHHKQFSQGLQIQGHAWDDRLRFIAGLYYFRESGDEKGQDQFVNFITNFRSVEFRNVSKSVFAQIELRPIENLTLTAGGRYTKDERRADRQLSNSFAIVSPPEHGKVGSSYFDPTFVVQYQFSPTINAYAKMTTAHRAGGFSTRSLTFDPFDPEKLVAYEIGFKSDLLDRRLRLNGTLFSSRFSDMQIDIVTDVARPDAPMVFNAGKARIKGAELEIVTVPAAGLNLALNYSYIDAKFVRVIHPLTGVDETPNFRFAQPKHNFSFNLDYELGRTSIGEPSFHLTYSHRSKTTATDYGPLAGPYPAYGLLDGSIRLANILGAGKPGVTLTAWARNLLNEDYILFRTQNAVAHGAPRTYGIDLRVEF